MSYYLVTGAAGFIGYTVVARLLDEGHTVLGIDNINDAYDVRLKEWRLTQLLRYPNFCFQKLDICDKNALGNLWEHNGPFSAVVNLAARAGVRQSINNPWVYIDTNIAGTVNLLELCRQYKTPKFVLASTSSLYGEHNPMPFSESADTSYPLSPYAASKKGAEAMAYSYHQMYGIDVTIFRFFTVYGPAGRPDMSPFRFVKWISEGHPVTVYGDGTQSRDFTFVEDIARGVIAGLQRLAGFQIINLGSDKPYVLLDLIHLIEILCNKKALFDYKPRHPADVSATWADISLARQLLDWTPQILVEEGMQKTVQWYCVNRSWAKDINVD